MRSSLNTVTAQRYYWSDVAAAGACAALLSGIPSTFYAWVTRGDVLEATRAAGAMLIAPTSTDKELFIAAALVHAGLSLFWALVLVRWLPHRHTLIWAIIALAGVAVLDLRVIGRLFPEIHALSFWPQFADHIAFGAVLGSVLVYRRKRRS